MASTDVRMDARAKPKACHQKSNTCTCKSHPRIQTRVVTCGDRQVQGAGHDLISSREEKREQEANPNTRDIRAQLGRREVTQGWASPGWKFSC